MTQRPHFLFPFPELESPLTSWAFCNSDLFQLYLRKAGHWCICSTQTKLLLLFLQLLLLHELLGDTQRLGFHYIYLLLNPEIISLPGTPLVHCLLSLQAEPTYLNFVPASLQLRPGGQETVLGEKLVGDRRDWVTERKRTENMSLEDDPTA